MGEESWMYLDLPLLRSGVVSVNSYTYDLYFQT